MLAKNIASASAPEATGAFLSCTMTNVAARTSVRLTACFTVLLGVVLADLGLAAAQPRGFGDGGPPSDSKRWSVLLRGAYLHQFDASIDDGGTFSADRFFIQPGIRLTKDPKDPRKSISLMVGYGYDNYDFSGPGFGALEPWDVVNSLRFSLPITWPIRDKWFVLVIPSLRFAAESGGSLGNGLFGGGIAGLSYHFTPRLSLGLGVVAFSQIEDDPVAFDTLRLKTGRGLASTLGPGVGLEWQPVTRWTLGAGARFERLRFRLDEEGLAPKGVGQDRGTSVIGSVRYNLNRHVSIALVGGVEVDGELRIEDRRGRTIEKTDNGAAGYLGFTFRARR
jgi:hypothetical protein